MCALYVSLGSRVRLRTFGCVAMRSAVLFCPRKTLCRYGCMYFLASLVLVCVDVMVMSSA